MKRAMVVACGLLLAAFIGGLFAYDNHLSPLARLRGEVKVGDPYLETQQKFSAFYESHQGKNDIQFSSGQTNNHIMTGPIPPTEHLFLYYQGLFDDLQLQVLFDGSGKAKEIVYIGD